MGFEFSGVLGVRGDALSITIVDIWSQLLDLQQRLLPHEFFGAMSFAFAGGMTDQPPVPPENLELNSLKRVRRPIPR